MIQKKHTIGQQYANMHLFFKTDKLEMDNTSFGGYTQKWGSFQGI